MRTPFLTGNEAIAEAVKLAGVEIIAAYPITPQTGIVDHLAKLISQGYNADLIHVESEFSALSVVLGSILGGIRSFTATSSQGLMMMAEGTYYAAGMRLPLVMAVVNRGLSAPVTIFSDHQDSMSLRDNGWLQIYCKDGQEALDTILIAYRIAEHEKVLLPVKVCIDGFSISHLSEKVEIPAQKSVKAFLPKLKPKYPYMDIDSPKFLGTAAWPDYYEEFIFSRNKALQDSLEIMKKVSLEFTKKIHPIISFCESYRDEDAEILIIGIGSMMSTLEQVVDAARIEMDLQLGLIRVKCFRPFPSTELLSLIKEKKKIIILDRAISPSQSGPLFLEISSLLHTIGIDIPCLGLILGIGGRDITPQVGKLIIKAIEELDTQSMESRQFWVDINNQTLKRWNLHE